jgi:hypothetical protein
MVKSPSRNSSKATIDLRAIGLAKCKQFQKEVRVDVRGQKTLAAWAYSLAHPKVKLFVRQRNGGGEVEKLLRCGGACPKKVFDMKILL